MRSSLIIEKAALLLLLSVQLSNSLSTGRPQFTKPSKTAATSPQQIFQAETDLDVELPKFVVDTNKFAIGFVKDILGVIYGDRHYARFAALETIARVPYFSYTSVLHLYETFGWFRQKEYIKLHFAETWNELHHLLIMESLGGSERFSDRFVAQHIAFFYYWLVIAVYMASPAIAYDLNKHVEKHAFNTYDEFLKEHGEELKLQPAPQVAIDYYQDGDLALFDAFQNDAFDKAMKLKPSEDMSTPPRRPVVKNLYDVFFNIRADEGEHAITMGKLQRDVSRRVANGENSL